MRELFRDSYGAHASITTMKDGRARLVVRIYTGKIIKAGDYASRNAARRAMGRLSDSWAPRFI